MEKQPQEAVQYKISPSEEIRCDSCMHFRPGPRGVGACELVQGEIAPEGICNLYSSARDAIEQEMF